MIALELLAREGSYEDTAVRIGDLLQLMDRLEPKNHALYHDTSLAFSRLVRNLVDYFANQSCYLPTLGVDIMISPTGWWQWPGSTTDHHSGREGHLPRTTQR